MSPGSPGDWAGAKKASDDARKYGMIGVIVGASLIVLYVVFVVVIFGLLISGASHLHPTYNYPS